MHSKYSNRTVSLRVLPLLLLPVVLTGQKAQEVVVPLKNWAAPLYWQPNQAERDAGLGVTPKITFSASQVSPSALTFIAVTPCRLVDTRGPAAGFNGLTPFSGPSLAASSTTTFPVQSAAEATADTTPTPCGTIPSIAQAYSFNITAIPKTSGGIAFVTIWPSGAAQPAVSTINDGEGVILANAAIVPAGTPSGGVNVINSGPATMDLVIDMNGFYAAPSDLNGNSAIGSGALVSNTTGTQNTASGTGALQSNTTGDDNAAIGFNALASNTSGGGNTAMGFDALGSNTTGNFNTASGLNAMENTTTGGNNTATGYQAMANNSTGNNNTAVGSSALQGGSVSSANTGSGNTATGAGALFGNTTGGFNTASGVSALVSNTTGGFNTVSGASAMADNTTGSYNLASGSGALLSNTTGMNNTAVGGDALPANTAGNNNLAIGYQAAISVSGGNSNNIHIGSQGLSGDSGTIRIGSPGTQTSFYVAGVNGVTTTNSAVPVLIDTTNGQLGVTSSSRRYKEDIEDMGAASRDLLRLRPVTFRYKQPFADGSKPIQYGLIAEEVAEVYPDLVAHSADGQIETVKYQVLDSMLLNEAQKQYQHAQQQDETIRQQHELVVQQQEQVLKQQEQALRQQEQIRSLEARLAALEALLAAKAPTATAGR
jgi:trimeric autotransporter adhesin